MFTWAFKDCRIVLPGASRLSSNAIKLPVVGGTGVVLLEPAINKNMTYINMIAANAPLKAIYVITDHLDLQYS